MISSFINMKIGRKLALIFGAGILLMTCLLGLSIWALHTTSQARIKVETGARMLDLGDRVASDISGVSARVSYVVNAGGEETQAEAEIQAHRQEYKAVFEELRKLADTDADKAEIVTLDQATAKIRAANDRVLNLARRGKRDEANRLMVSDVRLAMTEADAKIDAFVESREKQWAKADKDLDALNSRVSTLLITLGIVALTIAIPTSLMFTRSITKPLSASVAHLGVVAAGDVSRDVEAGYLKRGDEIGDLAQAAQAMTVSLREVLKNIGKEIHVLSSSSAELESNSGQMSNGSRQASEKAHSVAAAAEEVSTNVSSVAAGMEQATTNLANVSTSTEQMTSTIGEIAGNSEKARHITEEATRQAARITEQMNQLGDAAREIGKVTETITEISSQTNLLALNATIEAARAGSAGKGFAVVANEIKELAQQTAAATEDIKTRIQGVQTSTASGMSEIEKVSHIVHEVSDIVSSIAAAIEEQATVTRDISQNILEASVGVKDANQRVAETSQATREIAKEIAVVDRAAIDMADGTEQVRTSACELSKSAEHLQALVSRFRV